MPRQTVSLLIKTCPSHGFWKKGSIYGSFNSPWQFGTTKPAAEHFLGCACMPSEVSQRVFFSLVGKFNIRNTVVGLLSFSSPTTIVRFIVSVIVSAIKSCVFWPYSHVFKEIYKGQPYDAHGDSTLFIMLISWIRRMVASSYHILPRRVGFAWLSFLSVPAMAMFSTAISAPARMGRSIFKIKSKSVSFVSTVTQAFPEPTVLAASVVRDNGKLPISMANNIESFIHFISPQIDSNVGSIA